MCLAAKPDRATIVKKLVPDYKIQHKVNFEKVLLENLLARSKELSIILIEISQMNQVNFFKRAIQGSLFNGSIQSHPSGLKINTMLL